MRCPNHLLSKSVGYCVECGEFGCAKCLTKHNGQWYCRKHYQPIAAEQRSETRAQEVRRKRPRQNLVIRYADGRLDYGMSFALNLQEDGFYLERTEIDGTNTGEKEWIPFKELKAIFYVKSLDGKHDKTTQYRTWEPEGEELIIEFKDSEILRGRSLKPYDPSAPRFALVPLDSKGNNLNVIIERTAVQTIHTAAEFEAQKREQAKQRLENHAEGGLSQEETMGDFHVETRRYDDAVEQYTIALRKNPQSRRLMKKLLSAQYNVGVQHIKRHEYKRALAQMEVVLQYDPGNKHAKKKILQLQRVIEKEAMSSVDAQRDNPQG